MKHLGTKIIKTQRLTLRHFNIDDAQMMFDNWASNEENVKFMYWNAHKNLDFTKELLTEWCKNYNNLRYYEWCINYDNQAIGNISVTHINEIEQFCFIGYCLGKNWWNKGIMTEAVIAVRNFLINEVGFKHIKANYHELNPASGNVLYKCGFKRIAEIEHDVLLKEIKSKLITCEY